MHLLLLADPSESRIRSYLADSDCLVARRGNTVVGACVIQRKEQSAYELMAIATAPEHQRSGVGARLLKQAIARCEEQGASRLEVGTGSFGYQLRFYQKHGFRVCGIERDFFLRNYDAPIVEDGVLLLDMLRLELSFTDKPAS